MKSSKNGLRLNTSRYVDTFEAEAEISIKAVQEEIDQWRLTRSVKSQNEDSLRDLGALK